MSDPFSNKDYGEYFEALSRRISREESASHHTEPERPVSIQPPAPKKPVPVSAKKRRKTRFRPSALTIFSVAVVFVIVVTVLFASAGNSTTQTDKKKETAASNSDVTAEETKTLISFKETENTKEAPKDNDAESLIVVNSNTSEIVTARNPHKKLYPASTTKVMTILVAAERAQNYEDTFTMTREITDAMYSQEATVAGFSAEEEVTITDLLFGTILSSGGDAALGLAEKIAGSEKAFVALMNQKAEELGLKDTHFTNVTGLYNARHYTTAYDMAVILKSAMEIPICKEALSTYIHQTRKTEQHPEGIKLHATLFDLMYGTEPETATILGGKTGYVNESGYCIASYGENNTTKTEYLVVTMKNSARWPAVHGQIALYKKFAK